MNTTDRRALDETFVSDVATRLSDAALDWNPRARIDNVRPLTGGTSSLTYLADLSRESGAEQIVVKVSPPGLPPVRNRDVLRQATVMTALADAPGVLVPAVYFSHPGFGLDRPPFVAMEYVAGTCTEPLLEEGVRITGPTETRDRFLHAAALLGNLHRVDPAAVGLGHESVMTIDDEIARWVRAFETAPEDLRGDYLEGARLLRLAEPAPLPATVTHGDYRLGNTLCVGSSVTSLIDWEIWAVADPRIDLAWLTYFTDEADHPAAPPNGPAGTPSITEIVQVYQEAFGREVPDLHYFHLLSRYKEAAATALLIKRARRNGDVNMSFRRMEPRIVDMVAEVIRALS